MVKVNGGAVYEAPYIEFYEIGVEQGICISGAYNEKIEERTEEETW